MLLGFSLAGCVGGNGSAAPVTPTLTLNVGAPGIQISPTLFGLMFEEINHSGDGGMYAELLPPIARCSTMLPGANPDEGSDSTPSAGSVGTGYRPGRRSALSTSTLRDPVNTTALTESLRLSITRVGPGEHIGIVNPGYGGESGPAAHQLIAYHSGRCESGFRGPLTVSLESATKAEVSRRRDGFRCRLPRWRHYALDPDHLWEAARQVRTISSSSLQATRARYGSVSFRSSPQRRTIGQTVCASI